MLTDLLVILALVVAVWLVWKLISMARGKRVGQVDDETQSSQQSGIWGKRLATVGAGAVVGSILLGAAGVSGATLHNILQIGGLIALVVGFILWRFLKV